MNQATLTLLLAAATCAASNLRADDLAQTGKAVGNGNPLTPLVFCADPTAIEHEGRLYVYGTNDQQSFDVRGSGTEINYGDIKTLVMLSTDDMVNWTYHGTIDMKAVCGSWMYASWAPSIIARTEADGQRHFYMYFSNAGSVGVVTATSPLGPWTSPLKRSLVDGSTAGLGLCSTPFDPGACLDGDSVGWLALGGGNPNAEGTALHPGNARIVRLGSDLISLSGDLMKVDAPYHFEANELNWIGGQLVYTYNTSWSSRDAWSEYGSTQSAPSSCSMCYMTTTTPDDPTSWTYAGEYLKNPGTFGLGWGNNHTHLQEYQGKYYLFYHTQDLQNQLGLSGGYRSIAVNQATVITSTHRISSVTANRAGVSQLRKVNPFVEQQAETMATGGGIHAVNYGATGNTILSGLKEGDWTEVRGVNFSADGGGATACRIRVRGTGSLSIYLDKTTTTPVGTVDFATTDFEEVECTLTKKVSGAHDLYFVYHGSGWDFDAWQFLSAATDEVSLVTADATAEHFPPIMDLQGRPVATPRAGSVYVYTKNGTSALYIQQ
jgi:hypothetical protein